MKGALYCAGLGDVIRACYESAAYRMLGEATEPLPVIVASHNPYSIEIFRHHRNARNFILYDLAHKYEEYLAAGLRGPEISQALCQFAGISNEQLCRGPAGGHVPVFDAPDDICSAGHIVFQPFAGNDAFRSLPSELLETTVRTLRALPFQVFIVTRSYLRSDSRNKAMHASEDARRFAGGNITVLDNLTVPATLNLVKSCRAFVGSWSSLQQAAWYENKPVAVFYPANYHDAMQHTGYAFGMDRANTLGREFSQANAAELAAFLRRW